jgi:hypothetical protein
MLVNGADMTCSLLNHIPAWAYSAEQELRFCAAISLYLHVYFTFVTNLDFLHFNFSTFNIGNRRRQRYENSLSD